MTGGNNTTSTSPINVLYSHPTTNDMKINTPIRPTTNVKPPSSVILSPMSRVNVHIPPQISPMTPPSALGKLDQTFANSILQLPITSSSTTTTKDNKV